MTKISSDTFGINMRRFCKEHEGWVEQALEQGGNPRTLLSIHLEKLRWLQHERLAHLLVLLLTAAAEFFFVGVLLLRPETYMFSAAAALIMTVLLCFYFVHYFFLENTTQHWYRIAERLMEEPRETGADSENPREQTCLL